MRRCILPPVLLQGYRVTQPGKKPVINYRDLMERDPVRLYKSPCWEKGQGDSEPGCVLKGQSVCKFSGKQHPRLMAQAQRHCLECGWLAL
ncbi:hypothetical protein CHARACLAT_003180 [Characodon lateralis]|uniref:Uncharacterized protein n=1 Tax=Characodon lateralis TaxID=208331 RepID=A0ABU7DDA4_9TELE|nr:hypothetical protein [Characodon lateralis]